MWARGGNVNGCNRARRRQGAKAPGQRPPRHRRALLARRVGRWPSLRWVRRSLPRRSAGAGETRVAFPCSRPETGWKVVPCVPPPHGKGHRLCHSATLPLRQPGAKAPGQRPPRPWRALLARRVGRWPALRWVRRSLPHRSAGAGETRCVSLFPPGDGVEDAALRSPPTPAAMAKAIAFATPQRCPSASRGPKPPASARPAHGGRFSPAGTGAGLRCTR
jgi:hypothetical protein